jgi:hypothetical protein
MTNYIKNKTVILFVLLVSAYFGVMNGSAEAQQQNNSAVLDQVEILIGMGDSIGAGVQSGDASSATQQFSYINFIAMQTGLPFGIPFISSGPLGVVGDTSNRSRIDPSSYASNLAISGADLNSLLRARNGAATESEISSETDLVLFPWPGSQIEIAEYISQAIGHPLVVCWIGNNDVLSAVTSYDNLNATQMTSVEDFFNNFVEIARRLNAMNSPVVVANIPDVTKIALLMDRQDLIRFLGSDYGLPAGYYTTIVSMMLVKLGLEDGSNFSNPDYVLDSSEVALIQQRTAIFNDIIKYVALTYNIPVVDINSLFNELAANPPVVFGIPVTNSYLGGFFSLDGVHPSNFGHAVLANAFIQKLDEYYGAGIPLLSYDQLIQLFISDPFIDKDGDGRVTGRFGAGLLETIAPSLGFSGDENDFDPNISPAQSGTVSNLQEQAVKSGITREDVINAFRGITGR